MSKLKGAYTSLVRGVSEQVPHERLSGQHYEQVNFISDPIRGLARRRGSVFLDKQALASPPDAASYGLLKWFREYTMASTGVDYSVYYCTAASPTATIPRLMMFDREQQELFPVSLNSTASDLVKQGISSAVSVGSYILLSIQGHLPNPTSTDLVESSSSNGVIWVRGGAYSRTYTITYGSISVSYTTPESYYSGVLTTSDIAYDDPQYQKKVNDRVNNYNTAVNQYIADAQEAIQPENIANQLRLLLIGKGLSVSRQGSHLRLSGLTSSDVLLGDDGGNGEFLRVTHRAVSSLNDLTKKHVAGTVVAVEVSDDDTFYVKAFKKEPGGSAFQDVVWKEAAGVSSSAQDAFLIGVEFNGTLYVAHTPAALDAHLPNGHGLDVPDIIGRSSGDDDSNPRPDFFDRAISYMTVFQDRLVICSGANVFMSVPGDYFNWFRKSVLRVDPDDPVEVYALGAESDIIRGGSLIDRNLILIGDSLHYAISGRDAITPTNAIVSVQAATESASDAQPQALGGLLFYSQFQGGVTKLHQMQVGAFADSFDSFSVTQQVTKYIEGRPRQIVASSQPNMVLLSSAENSRGFYVFSFLDSPGQQQRLFDSWSRWEWDASLGDLVAMSTSDEGFVVLTLRECLDGWHIVADEFSRDSGLDNEPYLDSRALYPDVEGAGEPLDIDVRAAVLPYTHQRSLFGKPLDEVDDVLSLSGVSPEDVRVGVLFDSYYEPTPPYPRDRNDAPLLGGRTVLTSLGITLAMSAGIEITRADRGEQGFQHRVLDDAGFRINDPLSVLGKVPVTDRRISAYVGKEVREHRLQVRSKTWTPLNIATVEWTVQTFNRRR